MDLRSVVREYIECMNKQSADPESKAIREKKKQAKERIMEIMKTQKITYYDLENGHFLAIKSKPNQPDYGPEFFARAFFEFHRTPKNGMGTPEEVAMRFGSFVPQYRKFISTPEEDLTLAKKRPMSNWFQDQLNNGESRFNGLM